MAEERSLLPSEGSSRGPRGGGRAIEDGRVEEALVGVHARTRARGSRDEESVMLKLIKLGEMCTIVQSADTRIFVQVTFAFASSRARAMFAVSRQLAAPPFSLPLNLQCPKTRSHSPVCICPLHRSPAHRARAPCITHVSAASSHSMPVAYSGVVWEGSMGSDVCLVSLSLPTA